MRLIYVMIWLMELHVFMNTEMIKARITDVFILNKSKILKQIMFSIYVQL